MHEGGDGVLTHDALLGAARDAAAAQGLGPGARVLTGAGAADAVPGLLAPLVVDGSVVLHRDLAGLDPAARAALEEQEQVTG